MSYFNLYQTINYNVNDTETIVGVDIHSSQKIKNIINSYRGISYTPYIVRDNERPDQVAYEFYGNQDLDWIVLAANDIHNIYDEWPKGSETFINYIIEKYGSLATAQSTIKYYYNQYNDIIDATTYTSLSPTNRSFETLYEYEYRMNINKSKIKLIRPELVGLIQTNLNSQKIPFIG